MLRPLPGVKIANLPCGTIVDLRTIEQGDHHAGIIEMGFTAGEDFEFGLWAQMVDFGLGDEFIGPDNIDWMVLGCSEGFDLVFQISKPVPFSFCEKRTCEIDFHW